MAVINGDFFPFSIPFPDFLVGTAAADEINGLALDDTLVGLGGEDTLAGGADNDTLDGGADNDILLGEAGDDLLIGAAGADLLIGGADEDTADYSASALGVTAWLDGTAGAGGDASGDVLGLVENIIGSAFADTLFGDVGGNTLIGKNGNDRLWGADGADYLDGGLGEDHAHYEDSTAGVQVDLNNAGPQVSTGYAAGDILVSIESVHGATGFDNVLIGTSATGEHLKGGNFDDVITGNGGTGGDFIDAQGGDDSMIFNTGDVVAGTTISGGTGFDTVEVATSTDFTAAQGFITGVDNVLIGAGQTATFAASDIDGQAWNITGPFLPVDQETLEVNLDPNGSVDLSNLAFTPDWYTSPDDDHVVVNGSTGDETVTGSQTTDTVFAGDGMDTVMGGDGDDVLDGGAGVDVLDGGAGFDTAAFSTATVIKLASGTGSGGLVGDTLISIEAFAGSAFGDTVYGAPGGDIIAGGGGDDLLVGGAGHDALDGQGDNDTLLGSQGHDSLEGGAGDDTLRGGNGNDLLHGGAGSDVMVGGPGVDVFVFEAGDGADAILDFARFDKLDLSSFGFADFSADVLSLVSQSFNAGFQLDFGGGDTLDVFGKTLAKFSSADVIL